MKGRTAALAWAIIEWYCCRSVLSGKYKGNGKVVLNFGPGYMQSKSRSISMITGEINKVKEKSALNIAVCGVEQLSSPIQDFFEAHFDVYDNKADAVEFLQRQRPINPQS